jgi:hypothetical protein
MSPRVVPSSERTPNAMPLALSCGNVKWSFLLINWGTRNNKSI